MVYSLTDKLKFDENPKIEIKGKLVTVNAQAETALKLLDLLETKGEMRATMEAPSILFSEKDMKYITSLKLNMKDYATLISVAMDLCMGNDPDNKSEE